MGWMGWFAGQVVTTSLVLGTLKRHGVIVLHPNSFKNENTRLVVNKMVGIGEDMSELIERAYTVAYERVYPPTPTKK
ncbi:hypothetical protein HXX76_005756 [Chlamydomonas incerta]|uniref:Uncharacterized protein n=1 Tax=Chlamydomonas incerta TaxID=51695 RepID=A0A835W5K5_CHLIN|nr:hypothetical protein HXX76_005756 [Chlamydomonas incerta]|eukprot:KAG2438148.1 hypothetical protein HXX76_005756 [Chlamydomonas incerta]